MKIRMRPESSAVQFTALRVFCLTVCCGFIAWAQQSADLNVDLAARSAVIDALALKIPPSYVNPDFSETIVQALRTAQHGGQYDGDLTARQFAEKLNNTLLIHDKHLKVYYDPAPAAPVSPDAPARPEPRDRVNFGFNKLERLRGNIGYLEILSFQPVDRAAESAAGLLGTLANFDAIILDIRRNGGGNTPMVAFVASYFFEPAPVHLTDIYWRDSNETSEFWTWPSVPGRRSARQPLYILTSASTFSAAEDFAYALQKLKRAVIIGEQTGGGAHSGRGLQRLTPLFTAFIPVGRSVNPITNDNWEGVGVTPDIKTTADRALAEAHIAALRRLLETETDEQWKQNLRTTIQELAHE